MAKQNNKDSIAVHDFSTHKDYRIDRHLFGIFEDGLRAQGLRIHAQDPVDGFAAIRAFPGEQNSHAEYMWLIEA